MKDYILEINNLAVEVKTLNGDIQILDNINFKVEKSEIFGIVGESGSGKSITALSIMSLLNTDTFTVKGEILFEGINLLSLKDKEMSRIRGKDIAMIFQDPMTSLNPIMTVKEQIQEVLEIHTKLSKEEIKNNIEEILRKVKVPNPKEIMEKYPFQLSGGLRQRVMIAMAICCNPKLIIADEPTTALDVTIQMEILELLKELSKDIDATVIIITHDLGVIAEICSEVMVMYLGRILEQCNILDFFDKNLHPYSLGLIKSTPDNIVNSRFFNIEGFVPKLDEKPKGCKFSTRCTKLMKRCSECEPKLINITGNHKVRCFLYSEEEE
ncbi:ABC transporter ATP-binding protein [Hathewaya histolytica]|uniref:ABC transporter ATP-binding protein n=1 Tax=Hathewaya histolytica TaxID=1498 RepID=UPI003B67CE59